MPKKELHNEHELLARIAEGDEQAFAEFYKKYSPPVFKVAMTYTEKDISLSEEFVQIIFIKVWEARAKLANVESAEDYLFILSRNLIFDYFKKRANEFVRRRSFTDTPFHSELSPLRSLEEREYTQLFQQAIDQLPPRQKQIYELAKVDELPHDQIAAETGLTIDTVRTHLKLANRSVRYYIATHLSDPLIISAAVLKIIFDLKG